MKRRKVLAAGMVLAGLSLGMARPAAQKSDDERPPAGAAVLTEVRGEVSVQRAGGAAPAAVDYTTILYAGDRVRVAAGGGATVIGADGRVMPLGAGEHVAAQADGPAAGWFASLQRQLAEALDRQGSPIKRGTFVLRGFALRGEGADDPITCVSPRSGSLDTAEQRCRVPDGRPTFRWGAPAAATGLKLTLTDRDERRTFFSRALPDGTTTYTYPRDAAALAPGEYIWRIEGKLAGRAAEDSRRFTVPPPAEAKAIRAEIAAVKALETPNGTRLPLIAVLVRHALFSDAIAALEAARKQAPRDLTLARYEAAVYHRTDLPVPEDLQPK